MTTANHSDIPRHPGTYVRAEVIPAGMSVTKAAQQLGIGRPALSNFLNGRSSLSHEMAARLEKAFKADSKNLLDMQVAWDRHRHRDDHRKLLAYPSVPDFLVIKARQLGEWADQIEARNHLPVLLRKLVHTTGSDLHRVDFPGYDNAQRHGPDGIVEAGSATPWVPDGKSCWEFSTDKTPSTKARRDYRNYVEKRKIDLAERAESTFVFVSPRNMPRKAELEKEMNAARDWKAVRVYDASDLEQWLEQSAPAQMWLAEQLGLPTDGYETLEQAWHRWADVCEPRLTRDIFTPSLSSYRGTFKAWLDRPSEKSFVVTADSRDEALAFLACMFEDQELREYGDLTAVFESPETLRKLVSSPFEFIPIVHTEAAERALSDAHRRLHCIVLRPHNLPDEKPDITLDLLDHDAFEKALKTMGVKPDEIDRLARASGRSPTILRRSLSTNAAIRRPEWASDNKKAKRLMPIALVGAWHAGRKADRKIVSKLAKRKHDAIEDDIQFLLNMDDSPVWSSDPYHGVVSKIDALYSVAHVVTKSVLDRFFRIAKDVLSESDPALELPKKDRWAAALYDKTHNNSDALRNGLVDSLILLSVHGNDLIPRRPGIDIEGRIEALIRDILTPLTHEKLLSQDSSLPSYAEAAPNTFLQVVEEDLQREAPSTLGLLKPVDSDLFWASPPRAGLLRALECVAWSPKYLARVLTILAKLSQKRIDKNWTSKPINSLQTILSSAMPQTAASVEQRVEALEYLATHFPDIAWHISIAQFSPTPQIFFRGYRPRWRDDASGAGHPAKHKEWLRFIQKAFDILISWPSHDENTLGDLVEVLPQIREEDTSKVWDLIKEWSQEANEASKATLRECIRRFALAKCGLGRNIPHPTRTRARAIYGSLRPNDPVVRHRWLFANLPALDLADETEGDDFDWRQQKERIDRKRQEAIAEIWSARSDKGIRELIAAGGNAFIAGQHATSCIEDTESRAGFIERCLSGEVDLQDNTNQFLKGFLYALNDHSRAETLRATVGRLPAGDRARLFLCAPCRASTWRLLDDENIRIGYWKEVDPPLAWIPEFEELIECLLDAGRPCAALDYARTNFHYIETARLKRLLYEVATNRAESSDEFMLDTRNVSQALESLDGRPGVTPDEMAWFEFLFFHAIKHTKRGIPNLGRQITQSPELFVQVVALAYERSDEGEDPLEWRIKYREQKESVASAAHQLLNRIKNVPGMSNEGRIESKELAEWLDGARHLFRQHARVEVGDFYLGRLLAKAPEGENGLWPCEAVCEAMEAIGSSSFREGFCTAVRKSRSVRWRKHGEGGEQEREIAAEYRARSTRLCFEYPFVGSVLEYIAAAYDREAEWHDREAESGKGLDT